MPGKFVTTAALGLDEDSGEDAQWKPVLLDAVSGRPVVPNGTLGDRWSKRGQGRWNLDLGDVEPELTLHRRTGASSGTSGTSGAGSATRGVPARVVGGRLVTTVFDLLLAQYGVGREGLPGEWPEDYDDATQPHTPAWQEAITSRMYGTDAMSAFHAPPVPPADGTGGAHGGLRDRVSLLNRNGRGRPRGPFPERKVGSR